MKLKVFPSNFTYLSVEIDTLADKLAKAPITNQTFKTCFNSYVPAILGRHTDECFTYHIEAIKPFLVIVYETENRPAKFKSLVTLALKEYILDKITEHMDIIAYNYLAYYVERKNFQGEVTEDMLESIADNANEYTSPQELVDNLYSYLQD